MITYANDATCEPESTSLDVRRLPIPREVSRCSNKAWLQPSGRGTRLHVTRNLKVFSAAQLREFCDAESPISFYSVLLPDFVDAASHDAHNHVR